MVNAAAPLPLTANPLPAPAAASAQHEFSFDEAVASVRRNAARALEAHGGAPAQAVTRAATHVQNRAARAEAPVPPASDDGGVDVSHTASTAQTPADARAPKSLSISPSLASTAAAAAASAPVTAATPPAAPSSLSAAAALREASARIKAEAPRAPLPLRAPSQAVTQFAEILAQRLEDATQFDLRLDPPALGSVEGRLTLGDDGKATLALSFDNQPAFDLFHRDEGALRLALGDAGFDLTGRNLQFSFREPPRAERVGAQTQEASFLTPAPLHRGAIDIRA
jgi:hypothetical protein